MGVRLIQYNRNNGYGDGSINKDHAELINRDLLNQHPIYAITGLQEVLNLLEDAIEETNTRLQNIIDKDIKDTNDRIDAINNLNVINNVEDTWSIHMDYDETTKTLKSNVKIFKDEKNDSNALKSLADGLYVPKVMTEDSDTIRWSIKSLGETLQEIYNEGSRFAHYPSSWANIVSSSEANAWYWSEPLQSFVQPQNTKTFTGFVTKNLYDYYTHTCTLRSTDSDNDYNGLIIGYAVDDDGKPHTLSILTFKEGGPARSWQLIYDFNLPDSRVLFNCGNNPDGTGTIPQGFSYGGWNALPNGITLQVTKYQNIITCTASNWNEKELNENTKITIDLDDYTWGNLFRDNVKYGYCNCSQASSFFQDITFISENMATPSALVASVKISKESGNAIIENKDGIYCSAFIVAPKSDNALIKGSDGYYVPGISKEENNAIVKLDDGYYVRTQNTMRTATQNDHGFVIGDFIFYHPNQGYKKALAVDSYDSNIIGMVTRVIDNNRFEYMWSGFYETHIFNEEHGIVQGMPLYISNETAGAVIQEQPDVSKTVGYPVENRGIIISIERGIQYNQEASIGDFKTSANTYNVRSDGFIKVVEDVDYKQSLVQRLLDALTDDFKRQYIIIDNTTDTIRFVNTKKLYESNKVIGGFNLFIKAF